MAYTKRTWTDRVVEYARRYLKSGETETLITLTPEPGIITQAGTPVNADNLNHLESGVEAAHKLVEDNFRITNRELEYQVGGVSGTDDGGWQAPRESGIRDTRGANPNPSTFTSRRITRDYKGKNVMGLLAYMPDGVGLVVVETTRAWHDDTGGKVLQVAIDTSTGKRLQRTGTIVPDTWGTWSRPEDDTARAISMGGMI